jgi:hypothetical protein
MALGKVILLASKGVTVLLHGQEQKWIIGLISAISQRADT